MRLDGAKIYAAGAALLAAAALQQVSPQPTGPMNPPLVITSLYGRDLYEFYCAPCHGRDGKGSGPVVPALKTQPPDLTTLAERNSGAFPRARVEAFVTGDTPRGVPAHGSKEMPVWGPIFRALDEREALNKARIGNLVDYIQSLQSKPNDK
jgi:mono/diheme cytochrome c family protein